MAKAIMIQGTASGVGKTILTLALCRIFKQDGYSVAPFKAQNMTTNTYLTKNGDEIAISQWLQGLAAGVEPTIDMNPIVLKPPFAFLRNADRDTRLETIMGAYARLRDKYDVIVIEGAGSPTELNLNKDDMVNMGMAKRAKAPVLLLSDIDRGGIFASLYGTIALMKASENVLIKATIVNRFRGDVTHFADGVKILEDITKLPVAGVIPYTDINLPEEDNLFHNEKATKTTDFENQFDRIADNVRKHLDMKLVYDILNRGVEEYCEHSFAVTAMKEAPNGKQP